MIQDILLKLRREKSMTQKELGELMGVGERSVRYYESGERHPDFEGLLFLAYISAYLWTTWWAAPTSAR